jgi:hypothetical protein
MIKFIIALLFIPGCATDLKCKDVCVPGEKCKKVCMTREEWGD